MNATQPMEPREVTPTFDALALSEDVRKALDEIGYVNPTPVQLATYDVAVSGRDIIVQARTGTGKTAAFAIPLVDKLARVEPFVQALVLAPTRELALQSAKEIARIGKHRGLKTAAVYGGAPMGRQIDELAAGAQIVSGTPGRVLDHLRRGTLDASKLRVLVLDEMDEMLSMGFARELTAILELIPEPGRRQTMCFSATVDGEIRRHAERYMREPQMISLSSDAVGAEAISHHVYMVSGRDRTGDLIKILEVEDPESAIVFCNLRSETEQVAAALKQAGFNADWLNGDLPQRDREKVMSRTREGKLRYLVATDVAARGIDVSHLTHVINYSFPESPAAYVHRTGRTGRAGRTGCAVSMVSPTELGRLYYLRLEYKILPIERALPSRGELQTRKEADRVALLSEAFGTAARSDDMALARRLLTHPDAERIVGGLLQTFFGSKGEAVDEEAAAARRARAYPVPGVRSETPPASAPSPRVNSPARQSAPEARSPAPRRPPVRPADSVQESESGAPPAAPARRERERDAAPREAAPREAAPREAAPREAAARVATSAGRSAARGTRAEGSSRRGGSERGEGRRRERERAVAAEPSSAAEPTERTDAPDSQGTEDASADSGASRTVTSGAILYLDVGRRDGVRVSEIAKLLREVGELQRSDVGRIRMRDRHTLVDVPDDKVDALRDKLQGQTLGEKVLSPERAKVRE